MRVLDERIKRLFREILSILSIEEIMENSSLAELAKEIDKNLNVKTA